MKLKVANRSRRLAAKLKEILLGVKDREIQIETVMANEELGAVEKERIVKKIRERMALDRTAANRLSARKQQLAYEDRSPVPATRDGATHFASHTEVLTDDRKNPTRWTRISRRECICARAFFALQEAYAAR